MKFGDLCLVLVSGVWYYCRFSPYCVKPAGQKLLFDLAH